MKLCSTGINVTGSDGEECLRSLIGPLIAGAIRKEVAEAKHRRATQDLGDFYFFFCTTRKRYENEKLID